MSGSTDRSGGTDDRSEASRTGGPDPVASEFAEIAGGDDPPHLTGSELRIRYSGGEEPVIDGESISVPKGKVTALVGPNGSGKSTLLKGLARQVPLEAGSVVLDGREIHDLEKMEFARRLGLLSQENISPGSLSVEELVYHGRYPHRGFFESIGDDDEKAVNHAISLAGVEHLRESEVGSLSGGQKQLVWIAMILAQETDVLLLDEPTTFLDVHHQLKVMEIIEALRDHGEATVVLVLHDIEQAARYADHLIALDDGNVYDRGPPSEVVTEELLADVFGIEACVEEDLEPGPRITPIGPLHDEGIESSRRDALKR